MPNHIHFIIVLKNGSPRSATPTIPKIINAYKSIVTKEIGVKEGLEEGSKNEKIEIAKKMLNENMKIEVIERITGLTKTEIEEL